MIPGSANPLLLATAGAGAAYEIPRSVRFNSADSAYLSKTFASAGNRRTWTLSFWVKRSKFGTTQSILSNDWDYGFYLDFNDSDNLRILDYGGNTSLDIYYLTSAVYRDPSAWYHVVVSIDTTQATSTNRVKLYVNGSQVTAFSSSTAPAQNFDTTFNSTQVNSLGRNAAGSGGWYFNGYLADVIFVDGSALDPTSFGEFDDNNVWQPIEYSGSYGTNGFHLRFADNSSAAALGYDAAGSNDWTVNNLSVTAGAGNDSLRDSPTNGTQTDTGAGGEVVGNYCTLNPVVGGPNISQITFSNGNLEATWNTGSSYAVTLGTIGVNSGKWYWETTIAGTSGYWLFGIATSAISLNNYIGQQAVSYGYYSLNGNTYNANSSTSYGNSYTTNDIIGIALDLDNGKVFFSKNGTWQNSGNPASGTNAAYTGLSGTFFPAYAEGTSSAAAAYICNFGQRPFAYTAPSGFKALCTTNLPTPTIEDGSTAMDVVTYTGTGSALTPTSSLNFSPDLIWIKSRSAATDHALYDIVRGTQARLESNNTDAEVTSDGGVTAFNSTGFTLGTLAQVNTNAATYVGWCWDGGTSTVTNTDGTITSSVRANASAGISIVSYTGNGTSGATVGHGLNVAPSFYVCKFRNTNATSGPWYVYHKSLGATKTLTLNTTDAESTLSSVWNNTEPSSTVFSLGNAGDTNGSGRNFIAYCFAPVSGFSSFGSYTGNGSADGPFVHTGFRPRWILLKSTGATYFMMYDTARSAYNVTQTALYPGLTNADTTESSNRVDILSNGFKVRAAGGSNPNINPNAGTVVFAAFAEHPFSLARAR